MKTLLLSTMLILLLASGCSHDRHEVDIAVTYLNGQKDTIYHIFYSGFPPHITTYQNTLRANDAIIAHDVKAASIIKHTKTKAE